MGGGGVGQAVQREKLGWIVDGGALGFLSGSSGASFTFQTQPGWLERNLVHAPGISKSLEMFIAWEITFLHREPS